MIKISLIMSLIMTSFYGISYARETQSSYIDDNSLFKKVQITPNNAIQQTEKGETGGGSNSGKIYSKYEIILRKKVYKETYYEIHRLEH